MKFYLFICFLMLGLTAGCSRPAQTEAPQVKTFTFSTAISPTPINGAFQRYTDFLFHYRVAGDRGFTAVAPSRISPTWDHSVKAEFLVNMAEPKFDQEYESFYSYKLDGKEVVADTKSDPVFSTRHR